MIDPKPSPLAARPSAFATACAAAFLATSALLAGGTVAGAQTTDTSCYVTGGGSLEICRGNEAEGVFVAPRACESVSGVQILRTTPGTGPLQAVYQAETPLAGPSRRGAETCAPRRAGDPLDGGSVRAGAMPEQLATTMPPVQGRLWEVTRAAERPREARARRGRRREAAPPPETTAEGIAARHPITVAGRDWGGDAYSYVFFLAAMPTENGNRHALLQARTLDFTRFDIRGGAEAGTTWTPLGKTDPEPRGRRRRGRTEAEPDPGVVLDETGAPVVGHCQGQGFDRTDLVGSISVVDQVYHYFYTDVLPSDCNEPVATRRMGLYLRTSRDLTADRPWSAARTIAQPLPNQSLVRVAKARDMDRWVVAYRCNRPANTMDGPVSDICVQYTADLAPGSLAGLTWFSEPQAIMRSTAYLGLRSGGDGSGRFGRSQHFWMTDRYGNLATPTNYRAKAGLVTWLDRLAPGQAGTGASSVFGRPVYWGTWSVRPVVGR
ncbi:hypothetical protein [Methylobacterium goesingense]|uniref:Uncharacterized protein n=1 Tax=Methylobacterium goesingense TaxID=243690 RepID=A0ABV2L6E6_9HYPH|nr:hypothetical protein [Methylobacterium goesingense]GJD72494.1 hypothetical protein CFIICLFH_0708 [Methylobacterium goesingense]